MYGLESFSRDRIKREKQLHPDMRYSDWINGRALFE